MPSDDSETAEQPLKSGVLQRSLLSLSVFLLVLALALFLPAGIDWWQGWLFVAVFFFASSTEFMGEVWLGKVAKRVI